MALAHYETKICRPIPVYLQAYRPMYRNVISNLTVHAHSQELVSSVNIRSNIGSWIERDGRLWSS